MVEVLREQQASFEPVERAAADGDQVNIDFVGTKDGEEFEGGSAQGHNLVLGSGSMIPGFEEALVGLSAGERSEEHTSELQSRGHLVCRLLLEKKKKKKRCTY